MYDLGFLAIDAELGGPFYFNGGHSILELAMLPFPNPNETQLHPGQFVREHLGKDRIKYYVIKPYAPVEQEVLDTVLKRPLSYYEENGIELSDVIKDMVPFLASLHIAYKKILPVSDWHGDVMALGYLLFLAGKTTTELVGTHNMFHTPSYYRGIFGTSNYLGHKGQLGVGRAPNHMANEDCREIAEAAVRAIHYRRMIRSDGDGQKQKVKT